MKAFKSLNGVLFIVLGALVVVQIVRYAGLRFEAIPGIVLGLAMAALGIHRTLLLLRMRT